MWIISCRGWNTTSVPKASWMMRLSEAMTIAESVVKLGLGKYKLRSSKSEERGAREMDHKEDIVDGNGNGDNGDNWKP
ncbi:hypothetical protein Gotur_027671 [Gossypium turneri]